MPLGVRHVLLRHSGRCLRPYGLAEKQPQVAEIDLMIELDSDELVLERIALELEIVLKVELELAGN